jgi:hypothetical protein
MQPRMNSEFFPNLHKKTAETASRTRRTPFRIMSAEKRAEKCGKLAT